jgi:hypothetical protein
MEKYDEMTRNELQEELYSFDWSSKDFEDNDLRKLLDYMEKDLFS